MRSETESHLLWRDFQFGERLFELLFSRLGHVRARRQIEFLQVLESVQLFQARVSDLSPQQIKVRQMH